jgi:phage shock protein PspC (stress-responsive transcriptional regulator)
MMTLILLYTPHLGLFNGTCVVDIGPLLESVASHIWRLFCVVPMIVPIQICLLFFFWSLLVCYLCLWCVVDQEPNRLLSVGMHKRRYASKTATNNRNGKARTNQGGLSKRAKRIDTKNAPPHHHHREVFDGQPHDDRDQQLNHTKSSNSNVGDEKDGLTSTQMAALSSASFYSLTNPSGTRVAPSPSSSSMIAAWSSASSVSLPVSAPARSTPSRYYAGTWNCAFLANCYECRHELVRLIMDTCVDHIVPLNDTSTWTRIFQRLYFWQQRGNPFNITSPLLFLLPLTEWRCDYVGCLTPNLDESLPFVRVNDPISTVNHISPAQAVNMITSPVIRWSVSQALRSYSPIPSPSYFEALGNQHIAIQTKGVLTDKMC